MKKTSTHFLVDRSTERNRTFQYVCSFILPQKFGVSITKTYVTSLENIDEVSNRPGPDKDGSSMPAADDNV